MSKYPRAVTPVALSNNNKALGEHVSNSVLLSICFGSSLCFSTYHFSVYLYLTVFLPLSICFLCPFFPPISSKHNCDLAIFPFFCACIQNKHCLKPDALLFALDICMCSMCCIMIFSLSSLTNVSQLHILWSWGEKRPIYYCNFNV